MNPSVRKPLAPYIPEKNPDAPVDPQKAFHERQKAALESRGADRERQRVASAPEGSAPPPKASGNAETGSSKAANSASSAAKADTTGETAPASTEPEKTGDSAATESPSKDGEGTTADATKRGPRYEAKQFKKWAEENPEQAAAFLTNVGALTKDTEGGFIKLANKRRKLRLEHETRVQTDEKRLGEQRQALDRDRTAAETALQQVRPLADMWQAASRKDERGERVIDFDMADEAFRQNMGGMTIDEYNRARARRGVRNPESAALRAENLRLQRELAAKSSSAPGSAAGTTPPGGAQQGAGDQPAPAPKGAAATAPAAATAGPKPLELWGPEVPKAHGLRKFDGWADELHTEMQRYYDDATEEYAVDAEDVANKLLERKLKELAPVEELEPPAPRRRPAAPPPKRPVTPKTKEAATNPRASFAPPKATVEGHYTGDEPPGMMKLGTAVERALARARGELVD